MTLSVSLLLRFVVRSRLVSLVVVGFCVMAWISVFADVLGVVCRLQPVSDMTMRSENYRVRGMELTDLLNSGALSPMGSRVFVFVVAFGRTAPLA